MRLVKIIGLALLSNIFSYTLYGQALSDGLYTTIFTADQQLLIALYPDKAPMTVANFVGLAEGRISNSAFELGRPFFDGSSFDRVVPGHVIQGGVPNSDKSRQAGYSIPNEIHPDLSHTDKGMLGMANSGPHTASSVFYITLGDRSYLDGDYALFGKEIGEKSMEITQDTRIDSIRIIRVGKFAETYFPDDQFLDKLIVTVKASVAKKEAEKEQFEQEYLLKNYPNTVISEQGWRYIELVKGKGKPVRKRDSVRIRYTGITPQGLKFKSSSACETTWNNSRNMVDSGAECTYILNQTQINKGMDDAIRQMRPGSKWTVILKPEYAYGSSGYYPRPINDEKRFHFSPNTTLIYEVEVLR